jgi:tetratricopeptide (TPR) repeat protein
VPACICDFFGIAHYQLDRERDIAQNGRKQPKEFMQRNIGALYLLGFFLMTSPFLRAADYLGAAAVLQKISDAPKTPATDGKTSETAQLKIDIAAFSKQSASLKPEDAAQQWLKLLDRQFSLSSAQFAGRYGNSGSRERFDAMDIWNALPGPPAWDALRKAIEARPPGKGAQAGRDLALQLIAHTLVADRPAATNDLAQMEALAAKSTDEEDVMLIETVGQLSQSLLENSNDPNVIIKSLERRLAMERSEFEVPNLVPLVGAQKAEAFFRRAFSRSEMEMNVAQGEETKKLARKVALEMVADLKAPQWQLACSLDAGPLFEALEKKFAPAESDTNQSAAASPLDTLLARTKSQRNLQDGNYEQARIYYLLNLISQSRTKEATALARKIGGGDSVYAPEEAFAEMQRAGYGRQLHDFLYELLSQNPELPFWTDYISLAVQVGKTDQMLELARKSAARQNLTDAQRQPIRQALCGALLAADHVDEGVAELRQMIAQPLKPGRNYSFGSESTAALALNLAKIGRLTGNTNWIEEGIRLARAAISKGVDPMDYYDSSASSVVDLANFLTDLGRGPEAESLLGDALAKKDQPAGASQNYYERNVTSKILLSALVSLYYRAGRYADVPLLLDQAPGWGMKDIAELHDTYLDNVHQHEDSLEDSLRYHVAASLLELGRKEEAGKIANAILDENGGYDPAYEILVKIDGADLLPRLDELFARDQFEERPLIWKAAVLQQRGKLEEAEAAARKAISIDPSDGEQGPGRRMRAYAVLSQIRKARGDDKEAQLLQSAVDAIRLSENADRYFQAGLLEQAITMYEDSLAKFDGAYCIQSRLALRLSEAGKHEEAAEHYRRAYELMPDSFGRVESHCFGCEAAFRGAQAQSIAEKVFQSLAKTDPGKPQVHYLLGYLREEQGNYSDALVHFREAVKLDRDYLNAWKHMETVGKEYYLSAADQDAIAFNGIRLDPLNHHGGWTGFDKVTDLRTLWNAAQTAERFQPHLAEVLYPLPAAKAAMEKLAGESSAQRATFEMMSENIVYTRRLQPAAAILQNDVIAKALQMLGGTSYGEVFD